MRFLTRTVIGLCLFALTLGFLVLGAARVVTSVQEARADQGRPSFDREIVRTANVVTVTHGPEAPVLQTYGQVLSRRTLELRASSTGRVVYVDSDFQDGGRVHAGQLLVQIDPATAKADLDVARADLAEAEADLRDAERGLVLARDELSAAEEQAALRQKALERQEGLAARGVGTGAAVEEAALSASSARQSVVSQRQALATAEARIDQAKTTLTRAEIELREAQRLLDDTEIRAGFAGTLSDVTVVEGGLLSLNEKIGVLVDPEALEVGFRVSTAQHARLLNDSGMVTGVPVEVVLEVAGLDLVAPGVILRESPVVAEGQTGRQIFARIDQPAGFRPGDFVTVRVQEPRLARAARLPAQAYGADGTVLVVGEGERLQSAAVELLRRQDNEVLILAENLEGRQIVAERTPLLGDGIKIKPVARDGSTPKAEAMLALSQERRARLIAFVEGNSRLPDEVKTRMLGQLRQEQVPAEMVERLEQRMGS